MVIVAMPTAAVVRRTKTLVDPLAAGEGVVIAIGDQLRDDNAHRRHDIEIEDDPIAVARQRDGVPGAA